MRICLFGASSDRLAQIYFDQAQKLGEEMGKRNIGLIFGGGATGLMGAACRGVHSASGEIIGVAPRFFDQEGVLFQQCTELIFTDTMRQRKEKMENLSDAFAVVPGGIGTLEEFFEIFTLRQLGRHHKPIALLNTSGYYDKLLAMLTHTVETGFMKAQCLDLIGVFQEPKALLDYLEQHAKKLQSAD